MKLRSPAAERNRDAILEALRSRLPDQGLVLEVASGSGQHVVHFAAALPHLEFQPTDLDEQALLSIRSYVQDAGLGNVRPPRRLDTTQAGHWESLAEPRAVICCNMIHIAPWAACAGLFRGVASKLAQSGTFFLYGPFAFSGDLHAESNVAFDQSLKSRNPEWGIRDVNALDELAGQLGLERQETLAMPANNHVLIFRRS